jgi:hypothetical protein
MTVQNTILETIRILSGVLIGIIVIGLALIQYLKEKWGVEGKQAEIVSLVVGFLLGLGVVLSFLDQNGWNVSLSVWVGIALFQVVATIGPAGGYKTLRSLLGNG